MVAQKRLVFSVQAKGLKNIARDLKLTRQLYKDIDKTTKDVKKSTDTLTNAVTMGLAAGMAKTIKQVDIMATVSLNLSNAINSIGKSMASFGSVAGTNFLLAGKAAKQYLSNLKSVARGSVQYLPSSRARGARQQELGDAFQTIDKLKTKFVDQMQKTVASRDRGGIDAKMTDIAMEVYGKVGELAKSFSSIRYGSYLIRMRKSVEKTLRQSEALKTTIQSSQTRGTIFPGIQVYQHMKKISDEIFKASRIGTRKMGTKTIPGSIKRSASILYNDVAGALSAGVSGIASKGKAGLEGTKEVIKATPRASFDIMKGVSAAYYNTIKSVIKGTPKGMYGASKFLFERRPRSAGEMYDEGEFPTDPEGNRLQGPPMPAPKKKPMRFTAPLRGMSKILGKFGTALKVAGDGIMRFRFQVLAATAGMMALARFSPLMQAQMAVISVQTLQLGIIVGDALAPAFEVLSSAIQIVLDFWETLSPEWKNTISTGILVAGTLMLIAGVWALLSFAMSPVLLTILAIAAAVIVLVAIWETDFLGIKTVVLDIFGAIGDALQAFLDLIDTIVNGGDWITAITNFAGTLVGIFESIFGGILDIIMNSLNGILSGFIEGFKDIIGISSQIQEYNFAKQMAVSEASSYIGWTIERRMEWLSGRMEEIDKQFANVSGWTDPSSNWSSDLWRIGGATGGIVGGTGTADTQPFMLTPGEMILTKNDQSNLLGMIRSGIGGGGDTYNIEINMLDSSSTNRGMSVYDELETKLRSRGL